MPKALTIVNKLLEADDPDAPEQYLHWLGQKNEVGDLENIHFGAHIHTTDEDVIRQNAVEAGVLKADATPEDDDYFWYQIAHNLNRIEANAIWLLRKAGLYVTDEGHDPAGARVASVYILGGMERSAQIALAKQIVSWAEGEWPSTTNGTMDTAFTYPTMAKLYEQTTDEASFIDVTIEFTGTDALKEWMRLNLTEAVDPIDPDDDPEAFLRHYVPRMKGRLMIEFTRVKPAFPEVPDKNVYRENADGTPLYRYHSQNEMRDLMMGAQQYNRERSGGTNVMSTYRLHVPNPKGHVGGRRFLERAGIDAETMALIEKTDPPMWFYVSVQEFNDYLRMVYPTLKLKEDIDVPPEDDPETFIKRFKPRWELLSHLKHFHFYFKDETGRVAVADYSMANQGDPESAEDGLLVLDKNTPIVARRLHRLGDLHYWITVISHEHGLEGTRRKVTAAKNEFDDLWPKLEPLGFKLEVREAKEPRSGFIPPGDLSADDLRADANLDPDPEKYIKSQPIQVLARASSQTTRERQRNTIQFDASKWFEQATLEDLIDLAKGGNYGPFNRCFTADIAARFLIHPEHGHAFNKALADFYENFCRYHWPDVYISEEDAKVWVEHNRPDWYTSIWPEEAAVQEAIREKIDYPAVYAGGRIFIGPSHYHIMSYLEGESVDVSDAHHGWWTSRKRFLDTDLDVNELIRISPEFAQRTGEEPGLKGEQLPKAKQIGGVREVQEALPVPPLPPEDEPETNIVRYGQHLDKAEAEKFDAAVDAALEHFEYRVDHEQIDNPTDADKLAAEVGDEWAQKSGYANGTDEYDWFVSALNNRASEMFPSDEWLQEAVDDVPPEDDPDANINPQAYIDALEAQNLSDFFGQQGLESNEDGTYGYGSVPLTAPATLMFHNKPHVFKTIRLKIFVYYFRQWSSVSVYIHPEIKEFLRARKEVAWRFRTVPFARQREIIGDIINQIKSICAANKLTWLEITQQLKAALQKFRPYVSYRFPRKKRVPGKPDPACPLCHGRGTTTPHGTPCSCVTLKENLDVPLPAEDEPRQFLKHYYPPIVSPTQFKDVPDSYRFKFNQPPDYPEGVKRGGAAFLVSSSSAYWSAEQSNPFYRCYPPNWSGVQIKAYSKRKRLKEDVELPPEDDPEAIFKSHVKGGGILLPELKRLGFGTHPKEKKETCTVYDEEVERGWYKTYEAADGKTHVLHLYLFGGQTAEIRASNYNFNAKAWFQQGKEPSPNAHSKSEAHLPAIIRDVDAAMVRSAADSLPPDQEHDAIRSVMRHHNQWWSDLLDYLIADRGGNIPGRVGPGEPA